MTAEAILYKENDPLLRYAIYKAYKYRCAYTGKFLYDYSSMHLDHIIPQNTAPEVLQEKIRKYHLADDFTIDSLENILPTKSLHNNSQKNRHLNPEKPDVPLNKNDAFQKVQKRRVQEKR